MKEYLGYLNSFNFSNTQKKDIINLIINICEKLNSAKTIEEEGEDVVLDSYVFKITDKKEDNDINRLIASDILFNKVVSVNVIGSLNGIEYNTIGTYNNGYITAVQDDMQIVFNVDFNDGHITIESMYKLSEFMPHLQLEIGNSEDIKNHNLKYLNKLTKQFFFVQLDYGYGVGTYQPTKGGFAHITTAYGNDSFFTINTDGSIEADRDYIKPNEPYSLVLKSEQIGVALDEITGSKVNKAGELIISGTSGNITYTRTSDSTEGNVYFSDNRKDGKLSILHYNSSNRVINATLVN